MPRRHSPEFCIAPLPARRLFSTNLTIYLDGEAHLYAPGDTTNIRVSLLVGPHHPDPGTYVHAVRSRDTVLGNEDDLTIGSFDQHNASCDIQALVSDDWAAGAYYLGLTAHNGLETLATTVSQKPFIYIARDLLPDGPVYGTNGADHIVVHQNSRNVVVMTNGAVRYFDAASRLELLVDGLAGDDRIYAQDVETTRMVITGSGGNDRIVGGGGDDELSGANGRDRIHGQAGSDYILGGAQNDTMDGHAGDDRLSGGGGRDFLFDSIGANFLSGGAANDVLMSYDNGQGTIDTLSGGAGVDSGIWDFANVHGHGDPDDIVASVEVFLT